MRILHIGLSKNKGGIESFALNYLKTLRKEDVIFDFADIYGEGIAYQNVIEDLGGRVIGFENFKKHPLKTRKSLANFIRNEKYDAVHIHIQTAANMVAVLACKDAKVKPIVHCHTSKAQGVLRKLLHNLNISRLRRINAYHFACGEVSGKWFWNKTPFTIIPNAIETQNYVFDERIRAELRTKLGLKDNDYVLGYVGRLEQVKNPLFTLEVLRHINDENVKLLVLGEGSLKDNFLILAEQYGLQERVILEGYKQEVYKYLSAIDVFLMPSFSEAFSVSAVEAQANGLPCVFAEGLPREMDIIGNAQFISLSSPKLWGEQIVKLSIKTTDERIKDNVFISKTIYNLEVGSRILYEFYKQSRDENK